MNPNTRNIVVLGNAVALTGDPYLKVIISCNVGSQVWIPGLAFSEPRTTYY